MNHVSHDVQTSGAGSSTDNTRSKWWTIISCPRCAGIVILETNPKGESPPQVLQVIPGDSEEVNVRHLPTDVEEYYKDALRVLDVGVPDAAAVQLRRTLEAACAHHGVDAGPLVKRIQALMKQGLVTGEFGKVLDHVRKIGNVGAHAGDERLDEDTVQRALRFTTQVLRNLFEIPEELRQIEAVSAVAPDTPTADAGDD